MLSYSSSMKRLLAGKHAQDMQNVEVYHPVGNNLVHELPREGDPLTRWLTWNTASSLNVILSTIVDTWHLWQNLEAYHVPILMIVCQGMNGSYMIRAHSEVLRHDSLRRFFLSLFPNCFVWLSFQDYAKVVLAQQWCSLYFLVLWGIRLFIWSDQSTSIYMHKFIQDTMNC